MPELVKKYGEKVDFDIYRNTPFEFDATAESGARVEVATTTMTQPMGSWVITAVPYPPATVLPKWMPQTQVSR